MLITLKDFSDKVYIMKHLFILTFLCSIFLNVNSADAAEGYKLKSLFSKHYSKHNYLDKDYTKRVFTHASKQHLTHRNDLVTQQDWTPNYWASKQSLNSQNIVLEWERSGVIRGRKLDHQGVPSIIVGPAFYTLAPSDMHRFASAYDALYVRPERGAQQLIRFRDWKTDEIIANYKDDIFLKF